MTAIFSGWASALPGGCRADGCRCSFRWAGRDAVLAASMACRHRQGPFEAVWRALTWWGAR
jgi:uncharacterized protein